jgi:hypothetical protein
MYEYIACARVGVKLWQLFVLAILIHYEETCAYASGSGWC